MSLTKEVSPLLPARAGMDEGRAQAPMMLLDDDSSTGGEGQTDRETALRLAEALGGEVEEFATAA